MTRRKFSELDVKIIETIGASAMRVSVYPPDARPNVKWMRIDLVGAVAKLTSIANQKRLTTRKMKTGKIVPSQYLAPNAKAIVVAMTRLYERQIAPLRHTPTMSDASDNRVFVFAHLGEACSRMDSHNTGKGICDWLQREVRLVNNDRHVECFAQPKDPTLDTDLSVTTLYIVSADLVSDLVRGMIRRVSTVHGARTL